MEIGMKEVREEIDLIDRELVLLLARRQKCIEMAAMVKNDRDLIVAVSYTHLTLPTKA